MSAPKAVDRDPARLCTKGPCRAYRRPGSLFCSLHGEGGRAQAQAQGKAGSVVAKAARQALAAHEASALHLDTAEDVQLLLEATAGKLAAGLLSPPAAAAMNAICRSALQAIGLRVDEEATREIARANAARSTGVRRRP